MTPPLPRALLQFFAELPDAQAASVAQWCDTTPEGQMVLTLRKGRVCSYKLTTHGEVREVLIREPGGHASSQGVRPSRQ